MFQARGRAEAAVSSKVAVKETSRMGYKLTQWEARVAATARVSGERLVLGLDMQASRSTGCRS